MPDMNQKLERFRQLVLEDAQKERGKIMDDVDRQRRSGLIRPGRRFTAGLIWKSRRRPKPFVRKRAGKSPAG